MKTHLLVSLVGLAISFALPIFAQQKETVDPKLRERLIARIKAHTDALDKNDAAAVAANFTEDGIWVVDTGPLYGRQAIEKQVAEWFKGARSSNHMNKRDRILLVL
jgi:ketosteroid isomerase-like protein